MENAKIKKVERTELSWNQRPKL